MQTHDIATPAPEIAAHHKRWTRNRTIIEGEDAVKAAGRVYLPKLPSQSDQEYEAYKDSVDYFPAAMRTHESHVGLIFRKRPTLTGADGFENVIATISHRHSLDQLARELVSETLITNFSGLLVDAPEQQPGLSRAQAEAQNIRPFLSLYRAESILEVTQAVVANRFTLTRVRLLDDPDTVRELRLDDGVYTVVMHRQTDSGWTADEPLTPMENGSPQTSIPFRIVSSQANCTCPPKAPMDDICRLNVAHYRANAMLNNVHRHVASPIRYVTGIDTANDQQGYTVSPDAIWLFESAETEVGISEHSGNGAATLEARCVTLVDQMAAIGGRVIQTEKAAAEAAETLAIRRAAEGSIMAALASSVSEQLQEMLRIALSRLGATKEITYALNTDFMPIPIDAQTMTALRELVAGGFMPREVLFWVLKAGEIIPDSVTYEVYADQIAQDVADRPPVDAGAF